MHSFVLGLRAIVMNLRVLVRKLEIIRIPKAITMTKAMADAKMELKITGNEISIRGHCILKNNKHCGVLMFHDESKKMIKTFPKGYRTLSKWVKTIEPNKDQKL